MDQEKVSQGVWTTKEDDGKKKCLLVESETTTDLPRGRVQSISYGVQFVCCEAFETEVLDVSKVHSTQARDSETSQTT